MDIVLTLGLGVFSIITGLTTKRMQKSSKAAPIVLLCSIGFIEAIILRYYKSSKNKSIILGFSLVLGNIFGRSLQMVGLTGGIACGKSTVVNLVRDNFKEFAIIDCDAIAKEIVRPGRWAYYKIRKAFGNEVIMANGTINREALANIIFCDRTARKRLDRIMQPVIFFQIFIQLFKYRLQGFNFIILDAPLLFESKILTYFCCPIITVHVSNSEIWVERLCKRDLIPYHKAKERINCQLPIETKIKLSDFQIDNTETIYQLENSVRTVFRKIQE